MTNTERLPPLRTPLCPAGHLPLKGGDQPAAPPAPFISVALTIWRKQRCQPISLLEGEMSGRTEGGAKGRKPFRIRHSTRLLLATLPSGPGH